MHSRVTALVMLQVLRLSVFVSQKPTIPESIRQNYEQMEEERTKALIAIEKQRVAEKEAETLKKIAISEAEKNSFVSKIIMEQKLMERKVLGGSSKLIMR
ncbi:Erlin-2-B [Bienertia sinuspersici]